MHRILVIDDDEALRLTVTAGLKKNRFEVLQARNGAEGAKIARDQRVDLILCDLDLGEPTGGPAGSLFIKNSTQVPFILMTGGAVSGNSPGEVLQKPFTLTALLTKVRKRLKPGNTYRPLRRHGERMPLKDAQNRQMERSLPALPLPARSREQMRRVLARAETLRENEKSHLARKIHDHFSQKLTVLAIDLSLLESVFEAPAAGGHSRQNLEKLRQLGQMVHEVIDAAQEVTAVLRPKVLDEFGLVAALEWLGQRVERDSAIKCAVHDELLDQHLPSEIAGEIYRLAEAILSNVSRHSGASHVEIWIEKAAGNICMEVRDNGRGITRQQVLAPTSLGLWAMRERIEHLHGIMSIKAEARKGTSVSVRVPLSSNSRPA